MKNSPEKQNQLIISYLTLRRLLGFLGLLLPFILMLGVFFFGKCFIVEATVSQYYYTVMGDVFVGLLFTISFFLITYKGYDKIDNIVTNIAGVFAICIALFPSTIEKNAGCPISGLEGSDFKNTLHLISAGLFFMTTAFVSIFLFRKSNGPKSPQKVIRNKIYFVCGIIIMVSIALIPVFRSDSLIDKFEIYKPVFILEA
ncbi:MAG: hypothetical protein ABIY50_12770, partial [Ignavibacteria bacterium]